MLMCACVCTCVCVCVGSTVDLNQLTISVDTLSADRTVTIANLTGTATLSAGPTRWCRLCVSSLDVVVIMELVVHDGPASCPKWLR